jgi:hypothetical protein
MSIKLGIGIAMGMFIVFISSLAIYLNGVGAELTTEDYYTKDLEFQKQLDARNYAEKIGNPIQISIQKGYYLTVLNVSKHEIRNLKINFFRPNNPHDDISFSTSNLPFYIPFSKLKSGKYSIIIEYSSVINSEINRSEQIYAITIP